MNLLVHTIELNFICGFSMWFFDCGILNAFKKATSKGGINNTQGIQLPLIKRMNQLLLICALSGVLLMSTLRCEDS